MDKTVSRLDSLTGLRWWAAFAVFFYHYINVGTLPGIEFGRLGYTGVDFFFILSGFVLTWSARPSVTKRQFWIRRIARIWPAHLIALLIAIPVFYAVFTLGDNWWEKDLSITAIVASVFLVQGFSYDPTIHFGGNPAAWTLSCEAFFYLLHPLINTRLSAWIQGKKWAITTGILLTAGVGMLTLLTPVALPLPFSQLWLFFLGMVLAYAIREGLRIPLPMWTVYVSMIAVVIGFWRIVEIGDVPYLSVFFGRWLGLILPLIYTLFIGIAATADIQKRRSIMRHPILVKGGVYSYAFYLVHATVLYAFADLHSYVSGFGWFFILFLMALLTAMALHYLVEKPCEKKMRAWGDKRFGKLPASVSQQSTSYSPDPNL